jgi:hypothetical protein
LEDQGQEKVTETGEGDHNRTTKNAEAALPELLQNRVFICQRTVLHWVQPYLVLTSSIKIPWARRMVALLLHKPLVLLWVSGGPRITKVSPREIQWNHHYKYKLFKVDKYQLNRQEYKQDVKNYKFIFTLPNFIS